MHVYAIVPAAHAPPPQLRGLQDAEVEMIAAGDVAFWCSRHEARPSASIDAARAHNAVITAALSREITPVPVRFGQWFPGAEAAVAKIGEDASRWVSELERLRGRAEYGVRITGLRPEPVEDVAAQDVHPATGDQGTQYMMSLARKHAEAERRRETAERTAAAVASAAGALAADTRVQTIPEGVAVAHLVAWTDATDYHTAMRRLEGARPDLRFLFTGPWPPYSFVNEA